MKSPRLMLAPTILLAAMIPAAATVPVAAILLAPCRAAAAAEPAPPAPPTTTLSALKNRDLRVTLAVQNVPLEDVLRLLSKQFGLSIISAKNVTTTVTAQFKDITLEEALQSLVTINGYAYRLKGDVIEVYQPSAAPVSVEKPLVETFPLKYFNALKLRDLMKPFLTPEIGKIEADINGNNLIVYDMPNAINTIAAIIQKLDRPEPQVTITAEIIETSLNVSDKLGIDWQTRIALTGASRPITFPFSKDATSGEFIPGNRPAAGTAADEFGDKFSFPYPTTDDFKFGTLDATGLKAVLDILKTDTGTNLIANPEITTLNNREAKINIGDTVPVPIYTTNLETGVSAVTGFEKVDTGTILAVIPQVNDGGDSVTLVVKPEISEILGYKGQFDERPIVSSRRAETTVRLRNGQTLVIGGLVRVKNTDTYSKIPILGDIPLLGWLFKSKIVQHNKSTLYIFITPRIITPEVYTDHTRQAAQRLIREGLKTPPDTADGIRTTPSPFDK